MRLLTCATAAGGGRVAGTRPHCLLMAAGVAGTEDAGAVGLQVQGARAAPVEEVLPQLCDPAAVQRGRGEAPLEDVACWQRMGC